MDKVCNCPGCAADKLIHDHYLKRQSQFDELTAQGFKFDMLQDEYISPAGVIVPAWPPSKTEKKEKK